MSAISWIRDNAKKYATDTLVISTEEAASVGCGAGTYIVERFSFRGFLPNHMANELRKTRATINRTETETETLLLGGNGNTSQRNYCEFYRSTYTLQS
jgi:NAD(P)H-hydrate repair Nnr-like enzyme with NAD(P)H-hydrate dehydratase domain